MFDFAWTMMVASIYPRPLGRGPIEAALMAPLPLQPAPCYPRPLGRGPIEAVWDGGWESNPNVPIRDR